MISISLGAAGRAWCLVDDYAVEAHGDQAAAMARAVHEAALARRGRAGSTSGRPMRPKCPPESPTASISSAKTAMPDSVPPDSFVLDASVVAKLHFL